MCESVTSLVLAVPFTTIDVSVPAPLLETVTLNFNPVEPKDTPA